MSPKKDILILFDMGGVLIRNSWSKFYKAAAELSKGNISEDKFKEEYMSSGIEKDRMTGKITTQQFYEKLKGIIKRDATQDELRNAFDKIFDSEITKMIELKKNLFKAGYAVGIFSNCSEIALGRCPEAFSTYNPDFPVICSYKSGAVKPELPMYDEAQKWAEKNGIKKIILIEDKASYLIPGIEKYGWYGIQITEFLDTDEAIRSEHEHKSKPTKNFRKAETFDELMAALREFGVEI